MRYPSNLPPRGRLYGHQVSISLDEDSRRAADVVGNGNRSAGIRAALKAAALLRCELHPPVAFYGGKHSASRQYAVNLDDTSHALAAMLGRGNVSAGIRLALKIAPTSSEAPSVQAPPTLY